MRNKKGKRILKLTWVVGARVAGAVLLVLSLSSMSGCTPDIANDWTSTVYGEMLFDTSVTPAITPQPTSFALDPNTGKVDVSKLGIVVPKDCANLTDQEKAAGMNVARCEFYQYLTSLDGFPTLPGAAVARAPVSKEIDLDSVKNPANTSIFSVTLDKAQNPLKPDYTLDGIIYDISKPNIDRIVPQNELPMGPQAKEFHNLSLYFLGGWQPYTQYFIAYRGGPNVNDGLKTTDGNNVMEPAAYNLLKRTESLTCGTPIAAGEQVPETCPYFTIVNGQKLGQSKAEVSYNLFQLETIRNQFMTPASQLLDLVGNMPIDKVVMFWPIQTHSNPVAEFLPKENADMLHIPPIEPKLINSTTIRIKVKSANNKGIDNRTLLPIPLGDNLQSLSFNGSPLYKNGSILIADAGCDNGATSNCDPIGIDIDPRKSPNFSARYSNGNIELTLTDPTTPLYINHMYTIFMTDFIQDNEGRKMVPSPSIVFGKSSGPLVLQENGQNVSAIPEQLSLPQALLAEQGRLLLNKAFSMKLRVNSSLPFFNFDKISGITRSNLVYSGYFVCTDPNSCTCQNVHTDSNCKCQNPGDSNCIP